MTYGPIVRFLLPAGALILSACGGGGGDKPRLEGERLSVMDMEQQLSVDPVAADIEVRLPRPYVNESWPQAGGFPAHAMQHLALDSRLETVWHRNVVAGSGGTRRLTAQPVIAEGKIFILDANVRVHALNAETGRELWERDLDKKGEKRDAGIGGGVAYGEGKLFVTTGFGDVAAFDPDSGNEIWRAALEVPLRGAPTVADGRLFVVTHDNQLYAYNAGTGASIWYHVAIAENAGILGAASPAVMGETVVAGFSSGELFALRVENGRVAWSDALTRRGRLTPLSSINDIDGNPVIDRNQVYSVGYGERMVAIDLRSGARVWERNIASLSTPWVAGEFIYLVNLQGQLVCLYRPNGQIRWIRTLQRFTNMKKREGPIHWSGPILAGDRLLLVSSHGYVLSVSPYTGEILGAAEAPDQVFISPIVANETLYILDNSGELYALR